MLPAPIPKLRLAQDNSGHSFAQACKHSATRTERERVNAFRLARLAMRPDLTGWERQFIRSVSEKKHLSPKQEALIARLVTQCLNKFPSFEGKRRPEPAAFGAPHPIRRTNPNSKGKKQMKISKIFPSRWLKAIDLEADGETVTIRKLTMEEVGEERERKPVMSFEEIDRKLVLNVTNANAIADVTGKDDSDDWPGQVIKLVRCKVQFGAKTVDAIRIEAPDEPGGRSPTNSVPKQQAAEVEREVEMPY